MAVIIFNKKKPGYAMSPNAGCMPVSLAKKGGGSVGLFISQPAGKLRSANIRSFFQSRHLNYCCHSM